MNFKTFFLSASIFALLYSFFYGVWTMPMLGIYKTKPVDLIDTGYIVIASLLSGVIITSFKEKRKLTAKSFFSGGFIGTTFGTFCANCLGINLLFFGNAITITYPWVIPFLRWIQGASLSMLALGVVASVKNDENESCEAEPAEAEPEVPAVPEKPKDLLDFSKKHNSVLLGLFAVALIMFAYQIMPVFGITGFAVSSPSSSGLNIDKITEQVIPAKGFTIDASWGTIVKDMVSAGVLDSKKLEGILSRSYGQEMTQEWKVILEGKDEKLSINAENSVFMMYVLWALGKHNDNAILHESRIASYFKNYDIGVGKVGYGDTLLLELTPEQQDLAKEVSMNSYRPCCGNSAAVPDCSHGFAALGLIELMAAQGYEKDEIYDAFVKFNSFWFPANYIQNAVYFKVAEDKEWDETDDELVAGKDYSSIAGSRNVKSYLSQLGI